MEKRNIIRNGRGQIISYEILGESDSTVESQQYGDVELVSDEVSYTEVDVYEDTFYSDRRQSYKQVVDTQISNRFRQTFTQPDPNVGIGDWLGILNDWVTHYPSYPLSEIEFTDGTIIENVVTIPQSALSNSLPQGLGPFGFPGKTEGEYVIGSNILYTWTNGSWSSLSANSFTINSTVSPLPRPE